MLTSVDHARFELTFSNGLDLFILFNLLIYDNLNQHSPL